MVNKVDAMSQYIVYLRYMGQYLRSALNQILHGSFSIPSYDFSIGLGDDIGQIVRFHPFDFLSVFVPAAFTEYLYEGILLLRFYAAGLAFSAFAFSKKDGVSGVNVLSGSMVYVFCGFMLIRVVNHPTYAAPFIILPLLLLGAEQMMLGKGKCLFIFCVFAGFWSNYYFMFICSAALLVYVLVRFPEIFRQERIRNFFRLLWKMLCAYLLGLAMSMMTLCPMILRYLSSARASHGMEGMELFVYQDKRRYAAWFLNLISPYQSSGNGLDLNYAVIVLPALAVLFGLAWKKHSTLKKMLIACLLVLLIPGAGYVLAFFNRENNRWVFLLAMCCAMTVVAAADCFLELTRRQVTLVWILSGLFAVSVMIQTAVLGVNPYNIAALAQLGVCLLLLMPSWIRKRGVKAVRYCVLGITCVSTVVNSAMTYSPHFGAVTTQYVKAGTVDSKYRSFFRSRGAELTGGQDSFFRIEGFNVKHGRENSAIYSGYNGTSEYNSILNAELIDAMMSQNNLGLNAITTLRGMDSRPVSLNLAHVRYFVTKSSDEGCVPYGYSREAAFSDDQVRVYECEKPLSFGCSSRAFITREDYDALSPLEKEMVQLEAFVAEPYGKGEKDPARELREAGFTQISRPGIQILSEAIPSAGSKGASWENGLVHAEKKGSLTFPWNEKAGYDAYLLLEGVEVPGDAARLRLSTRGYRTSIYVRDKEHLYSIGRKDYLIHLGYSEQDGTQKAELRFQKAGKYALPSMRILYVPMEEYEAKIDALNGQPLENETVEDGSVFGTVNFDTPRILMLSVPHADGWTVTVDGKRADSAEALAEGIRPLTVNVLYQGIVLPAGKHTIALSYATPGAAASRLIAIPAILLFFILLILERRSARRKGNV